MPSIDLIDTSAWQEGTDWQAVRASGVKGAVIKATEGTGYVSEVFARDWPEVRRLFPYHGAYHYMRPNRSVSAQVSLFCDVVGPLDQPGDLGPVCDAEEAGLTAATCIDWLEQASARTGKLGILYASWSFVGDHLSGDPAITRFPLWVAAYNNTGWQPAPRPYTSAFLWQFSSSGIVPGVATRCDVNEIADHAVLSRLAGPATEEDLPLNDKDRADIDALIGRSAGYVHAAVQADIRTAEKALQDRAQALEANVLGWMQQGEARDAARDQSLANAVASIVNALERHVTSPVDEQAVATRVVDLLGQRINPAT